MAFSDKLQRPKKYIAWYRLLKLKINRGTNEIIDAVLKGEEL